MALGSLEKEIMDILWSSEDESVREVYLRLKKTRTVAYTTVMTIMMRLSKKGYLKRKKQGNAYIYTAKKTKSQAVKDLVKYAFKNLTEEFGEVALAAFADEVDSISVKKKQKLSSRLKKQINEKRN